MNNTQAVYNAFNCSREIDGKLTHLLLPLQNLTATVCQNVSDQIHLNSTWSNCFCTMVPPGVPLKDWFEFRSKVLLGTFSCFIFIFGTVGNSIVFSILASLKKVSLWFINNQQLPTEHSNFWTDCVAPSGKSLSLGSTWRRLNHESCAPLRGVQKVIVLSFDSLDWCLWKQEDANVLEEKKETEAAWYLRKVWQKDLP